MLNKLPQIQLNFRLPTLIAAAIAILSKKVLITGSASIDDADAALHWLPTRASEQGNVIGLVSVYMCTKKVIE